LFSGHDVPLRLIFLFYPIRGVLSNFIWGLKRYYALALENGNEVPIREAINPNRPSRNPVYANGVHMHKGGRDWNWSVGCVTIYKDDWARYISIFPVEPIGTHVGTFYLLD
jgi:hypothetical protein